MQNIQGIGNEPYVAADPVKSPSCFDTFRLSFGLFIDVIKVIVLIIPHMCVALYRVVVKPPRKSVSGQTVLVCIFTRHVDHCST